MTKGEAFESRYPNYEGEVDFALPQQWVDKVVKVSGVSYDRIVSQFAWRYDPGDMFGKPTPLTEDAEEIRRKWHMLF
jgi:hypothetical protein